MCVLPYSPVPMWILRACEIVRESVVFTCSAHTLICRIAVGFLLASIRERVEIPGLKYQSLYASKGVYIFLDFHVRNPNFTARINNFTVNEKIIFPSLWLKLPMN